MDGEPVRFSDAVDSIIITLVEEGYRATNSTKDKAAKNDGGMEFINSLDRARGYFSSALFLAQRFGISQKTLDHILEDYIKKSKKIPKIFHSISLLLPELEFAKLGASKDVVENLAEEHARCGQIGCFEKTIQLLKRKPLDREVGMIVKNYIDGASESQETEKRLIELAERASRNIVISVSESLRQRRERWRMQSY